MRIIIDQMQANNRPCTFGPKCNFKLKGQPCPQWHFKCKFGKDCKFRAKCPLEHDDQPSKPAPAKKVYSQPINEVECRFGQNCKKFALGQCLFKHSVSPANPQSSSNPQSIQASFNPNQGSFQPARIPAQPVNNQNFKTVFNQLSFNFISGHPDNSDKLKQFTITKTIQRVFQQTNTDIRFGAVMKTSNQTQPVYLMVSQGRIIFCQLANLAKESGNQHINNSTMVLKRCFQRDFVLQELIEKVFFLQSLSKQFERTDIILIQKRNGIALCITNRGVTQDFQSRTQMDCAAFIGNSILILNRDKTLTRLSYQNSTKSFNRQNNIETGQPLKKIKSFSKTLFGSQIAVAITDNQKLVFFNEKLQLKVFQIEQNVNDVVLTEKGMIPVLLAQTNTKIIAINLMTLQTQILLEINLAQNLALSSLCITNGHLFIGINNWGIIAYNVQNCENPIGILALGRSEWHMNSDDRGNLCLLGNNDSSRTFSVFKIQKC